jgi:hypothetical protein
MYLEDEDSSYYGLALTGEINHIFLKTGLYTLNEGEADDNNIYSLGVGFTF